MSAHGTHGARTRGSVSSVMRTMHGPALTRPTKLCFIVEEKYETDRMPGVVADTLVGWGHEVDILRPHSTLTDIWALLEKDYDAYVLKTVSSGPGLSILESVAAAGRVTVNDHRAIRLARDKAVAAARARAAGIPFPVTYFASRSSVLHQVPREMYPLVVKPNNGSSCERIFRADTPEELAGLDLDESGHLLAQPYLSNPGYDVKLYNTCDEVFAAVKRSPLHPGEQVVEQPIEVTPELRAIAEEVGRVFGLDIYGVDVVETSRGWVVLDVNDFPSFGGVPDAPLRLARTVLHLAHRAAAAAADTAAYRPASFIPTHRPALAVEASA